MINKKTFINLIFLVGITFSLQSSLPPHVIPSPIRIIPNKVITDQDVLNVIKPDLTFMIADLKYTKDKKVKIIEFGDGCFAGFKVLDHTVTPGIIWSNFWRFLKKDDNFKNLQVWYVGKTYPKSIVGWDTFQFLNGIHVNNIQELKMNRTFNKLAKEPCTQIKTLKDYKGIIVFKRYKSTKKELDAFKKKYPQFLILNHATTKHAGDKKLTDEVFDTPELKQYRPKSAVYPKIYTKNLAQKIKDEFNCKWYIIKPIFCGRGNGVIGVPKKRLDRDLKLVLKKYNNYLPYDNTYSFRPNNPLTYSYWKHDRNSHFLVEEFVESKHITYNNGRYDATIRVAFTLHHNGDGKIYLNYLGSYWKRPVKALGTRGTFREKHISKHAPNYFESLGGEVSKEDLYGMYNILKKVLPDVYANMLVDFYTGKVD